MLSPAGLLPTLPQRVTALSASPLPVALPGAVSAGGGCLTTAVAMGTASGGIEVAAVQQGALLPLQASISASLAAHPSAVKVSALAAARSAAAAVFAEL